MRQYVKTQGHKKGAKTVDTTTLKKIMEKSGIDPETPLYSQVSAWEMCLYKEELVVRLKRFRGGGEKATTWVNQYRSRWHHKSMMPASAPAYILAVGFVEVPGTCLYYLKSK